MGIRVNQIYDIDNRTYLIRLQKNEEKVVLLLESGNRIHTTAFEWPKNVAPSGFTMKLRKHLKNKRLERIQQLGIDRIIDLQFGMNEAAYHIIIELYDRGNIILTDHELTILNILRPHVEGEEVRFAVREKYPINRAKQLRGAPDIETLREAIKNASGGDNLRTVLNPLLDYGPSVIDHVLQKYDLLGCVIEGEVKDDGKKKKKQRKNKDNHNTKVFNLETDLNPLINAINEAETIIHNAMKTPSKGYIIQKKELKPAVNNIQEEYYFSNLEYHPFLFNQFKSDPYKEFESFDLAVDEFYSTQESQKIDLKTFQQEREALKKLSNVKNDHAKRLVDLSKAQIDDRKKAELITRNQKLVDNAILAIQSAIASQMSWPDIHELLKAAQTNKDPVASTIKQLKLETNHISILLKDPYALYDEDGEESDEDDEDREDDEGKLEPMVVDIDLAISAFANARRYYDLRRTAVKKEQKTIESSGKALKSAERRTQQTLKEVRAQSTISKARKVFWFEKFYWFISTENYLVIGGRDQQQNELIVKRYMRPNDIYVHAEIQGASSVIIKNPSGNEVPPKTLLEAGTMAISYSVAWDAKVVTTAYWVKSDQVSKTAPTGEYLTTGSFMIRGKKNFLPPCHLVLGLSFLFKLEDGSIERHKNERRVRNFEEEAALKAAEGDTIKIENEALETVQETEEEVALDDSGDDDNVNGDDGEDLSEQTDKLVLDEDTEKNVVSEASSDDDTEQRDEEVEEEIEEEDDGPHFPDTHVKIEHDTGKVITKADPLLQRLTSESENPENVIFMGDDKPYIIQAMPTRIKQQKQKKLAKQHSKEEKSSRRENQNFDESKRDQQPKRGQKGKIKKIKEKYKDQDEDERKLRMEILKSSGMGKDAKKTKKGEVEANQKALGKKPQPRLKPLEEDIQDDAPASADVDMLDSLTGCPHEEDELLFAVPVIAPYQTLHSYK